MLARSLGGCPASRCPVVEGAQSPLLVEGKADARVASASPTPKVGSVTIWLGPKEVKTGSERCSDTGGRSSLPPRSQPEPGIAEHAAVRLPA